MIKTPAMNDNLAAPTDSG